MTNVRGGSTCVRGGGRRLRSNGLFTRRGRAAIPLSRVILAPDPNQSRHQSQGGRVKVNTVIAGGFLLR